MISIASGIMKSFGLKDADFEIRLNSRKIINYILNDLIFWLINAFIDFCLIIVVKKNVSLKEKMRKNGLNTGTNINRKSSYHHGMNSAIDEKTKIENKTGTIK